MEMQVLESTDINGFENALFDSLDYLEEQGLGNLSDETPIFILMGKNGKVINNSFGVDARVFIGGTMEEVIKNLQDSISPKPTTNPSGFRNVATK
jgi:hypothetical protein